MKLALGQLLVEGGEPERNLQRAQKMIEKAVAQNADIILLPETLDFAWTHPSALTESEPIPGIYSEFFCDLAKKHQLMICLGLSEKVEDKNYNSAILIDQNGEIILKHRKINLLNVEFPYYEIGQKLEVVDTPFGKIGLNICADNYGDALHLGHALARMGAQIILSPSSWTVDYHVTEIDEPYYEKWIKPFKLLASMHDIIIASATSVGYIVGGPYEGKKSIGKSLVINQNGVLSEGAFNEFAGDMKIVEFEIPPAKVKGTQIGESLKKKGYQFDL
ncbi:MAG TPA: carbon-nitrogen hydrolase family protein [Chitinophagales bacterium]|nr:carbon-nitrogen hydrolase family protein [Chitinophagales bacterium]